ncbi:hypothetical protein TCE0_033f09575 [Talaromyces pinophilus]|uniref:Uncharacterized protein n=1 Tax=Talaromyces pinophilus TaxID=128442 RepID=A0A6V8HB55_TALPI|nr:hypothetical protein TCE0_033f09575 [Talaromyces pinophilus]
MEEHSQSSSLPEGPNQQHPFHQEPSDSHPPPSQSSQTYTQAPSGTGASAQSATVTTENMDPIAYEAAFADDMQALPTDVAVADERDFSLVGSWAAGVDPHTALIENDPILSSIHRVGPVVDFARNNAEATDRNGSENTDEAVGILRANLHRKV